MQRARAQMRSRAERGRVRRPLRWMVSDPREVEDESLMDSSSVRLPSNPEILRKTTSDVLWGQAVTMVRKSCWLNLIEITLTKKQHNANNLTKRLLGPLENSVILSNLPAMFIFIIGLLRLFVDLGENVNVSRRNLGGIIRRGGSFDVGVHIVDVVHVVAV